MPRSPMAIRCCYMLIAVGVFAFAVIITVTFFAFTGRCPGGIMPSVSAKNTKLINGTELPKRIISPVEETKQLIRRINEYPNNTWNARFNEHAVGVEEQRKATSNENKTTSINTDLFMVMSDMLNTVRLNGIFHQKYSKHLNRLVKRISEGIPLEFDARDKWPECELGRIYDQGGCGSCWAVAAASVMSDRLCIRSNGGKQVKLSAQKLIECCSYCGGCNGSVEPLMPFYYWYESGLVSEDCYPYTVTQDCGYPCKLETYFAPKGVNQCSTTCINGRTERRRHADYVYRIGTVNKANRSVMNSLAAMYDHLASKFNWPRQVDDLMLAKADLMEFGPFSLCFPVHEGFLHYYDGIYKRIPDLENVHVYDHCVKMVAWGEEKGQEYFVAINSWSKNWGKDGTFKLDIKMLSESRGDMYSAMADLNY